MRREKQVPDVKGMNLRIAENELDKQSLKSIVIDSSYVKGKPPPFLRLSTDGEAARREFVPAGRRFSVFIWLYLFQGLVAL